MSDTPNWYKEENLKRVRYDEGYYGWVVDMCDGTCRYANNPLLGEDGPNWGDRVPLIDIGGEYFADYNNIIERFEETNA